jgi:hypothetical protein
LTYISLPAAADTTAGLVRPAARVREQRTAVASR